MRTAILARVSVAACSGSSHMFFGPCRLLLFMYSSTMLSGEGAAPTSRGVMVSGSFLKRRKCESEVLQIDKINTCLVMRSFTPLSCVLGGDKHDQTDFSGIDHLWFRMIYRTP